MNQKKHIFISYSRKDADIVDLICRILPTEKLDCFVDRNGIHGAEDFVNRIAQEICNADLVLFIGSINSSRSLYVKKELLYALGKGIPVLPYIVDDNPLPDSIALLLSDINQLSIQSHPVDEALGQEVYLAASGQKQNVANLTVSPKSKPCKKTVTALLFIAVATVITVCWSILHYAGGDDGKVDTTIAAVQAILQQCDSLRSLNCPEKTADNEIELLLKAESMMQHPDFISNSEISSQCCLQSVIKVSDDISHRLDSMSHVWKKQARIALDLYDMTHIKQEHSFAEEYVRIAGRIKKDTEWIELYDKL